jgi:hypothetical protein
MLADVADQVSLMKQYLADLLRVLENASPRPKEGF